MTTATLPPIVKFDASEEDRSLIAAIVRRAVESLPASVLRLSLGEGSGFGRSKPQSPSQAGQKGENDGTRLEQDHEGRDGRG
jgi:hypothetical protein